MVVSLLLHRSSLARSTTLSSTVTIWCVFHVDYTDTSPSHRSRTAQRHQVPRPTRSRHSVRFSLILRCHCALCLQHTTLPQQAPLCNSPSRSFCSCVLLNNPSGAQFHSDFVKTSVKHRPPATQETRWQTRSLMPQRSSLLPSSSSVASSPVLPPAAPSVSAVPVVVTFAPLSHARSSTVHHRRHQVSRFKLSLLSLPRQVCHSHPLQRRPCSDMLVSPKWECTPLVQQLAGTHPAIGADPRAGRGPLPKPRPVVLPLVSFGQAKPAGLGHIHNAESDLMHHQYRLSILQWNPGPARRNPTQITAATCGRFHAVILQEASDHVPHITDRTAATRTSPSCSTRTPFEPNPAVFAFNEASTSKETWDMVILIVRGLLRRPSLSGTPTVTFCSVQIHNIVAKKRDASTDLLRRLRGYMHQHNVDFIGGDFSMSAFSTVGDVFSDSEFAARGNSLLWGLGGLNDTCRECTGFLIMPWRPYEWRVDAHACFKFDNAELGFGPRDQTAHFPVYLPLRTSNLAWP